MTRPEPPEGFRLIEGENGRLLVDERLANEALEAGLGGARGWEPLRRGNGNVISRGAIVRLELSSGARVVLKQLRRGGLAGPLWKDRFLGPGRLLSNLRLPLEALARGVTTPRPVALRIVEGPPALFRGWLAVEEVRDAIDLASRFLTSPPPRPELGRVMRLVRRMHEVGLEHRDLNLGNLLVAGGAGENDAAAHVIDLDGARLHDGPLPFALRQRGLRRLERSCAKLLPGSVNDPGACDWIYDLYSGGDTALAGRLERGRALGRFWIRLHRPGWRG